MIDALEDRGLGAIGSWSPASMVFHRPRGLATTSTLTQPVELLVEQAIALLLGPSEPESADIVVAGELRPGCTTKSSSISESRKDHG